jgi:glycosyltransferase involved in cell wall biosynthesis
VGSLVPDRPPYNAPPFSRSGNLFQTEVVQGLTRLGLEPSLVLSFATLPSFPKHPRWWVAGQQLREDGLPQLHLQSFINVTPFKQLGLGLSSFFRLAAWSLARLGKPRVILAYNLTVPPGLFVWLAARLTGAKLCVSLNDIEVPGVTVPDTCFFRWDFQMHRFLIPRLDGRVVMAEATQQDFAPGLPCLRVEGGVGEELIRRTQPQPRLESLPKPEPEARVPFRLVAVGKLDETNGFDLMLEAMQHLPGDGWSLDIAGAGPLAPRIEAAAQADPRIRVHGFLDLEGVLALYRQADLLLVIRKTQARNTRYFFPVKLFEALLSAVPVLATNTGHLKAEYGAYLHVLEEETAEGLAQGIQAVRATPVEQRRKLGARARAFMIQEKHWQSQCRKIKDYLEGLC